MPRFHDRVIMGILGRDEPELYSSLGDTPCVPGARIRGAVTLFQACDRNNHLIGLSEKSNYTILVSSDDGDSVISKTGHQPAYRLVLCDPICVMTLHLHSGVLRDFGDHPAVEVVGRSVIGRLFYGKDGFWAASLARLDGDCLSVSVKKTEDAYYFCSRIGLDKDAGYWTWSEVESPPAEAQQIMTTAAAYVKKIKTIAEERAAAMTGYGQDVVFSMESVMDLVGNMVVKSLGSSAMGR